jgi:peroxiredoxin
MRKQIFTLAIVSAVIWGSGSASAGEPTLTEQLRATAEASKAQTPAEPQAVMDKAMQTIKDSGMVGKALKKGDTMPDFTLPGADGKPVSSKQLREKNNLIVTFYRGGWCPFCSLQLRDLQKHLLDIQMAGGHVVAISPQTPDGSLSTTQKQGLGFDVLSDSGNKTAKTFGVSYQLPPDLVALYKQFGLDLAQINGSKEWELPLAATYVVNKKGKVVYAFVDADYTKRAETLDVIQAVKDIDRKYMLRKH